MLLQLLVTILNRIGESEKKPWEKGNSELIKTNIIPTIVVMPVQYIKTNSEERISAGISDINLSVAQVYYKNMNSEEHISSGISDITLVVTKI